MNRARLDLRLVAAAGLALIAGLVVLSLTQPPERISVLVAAEALPAGVPFESLALREEAVEPLHGLVPSDRSSDLTGWSLSVPIEKGAPLTESVLSPPPGSLPDLIAVTLEPGHAVQGRLVAGDAVDIYVTDDSGTRLLAESVAVIAAEIGSGGLAGGDVALLVAVDELLAPELVSAMRTAEIDLVRVTP